MLARGTPEISNTIFIIIVISATKILQLIFLFLVNIDICIVDAMQHD